MKKYIAILRGINVGGKRKILMKDLKLLFERMGCTEIATYIQSGNVIFYSGVEKTSAIMISGVRIRPISMRISQPPIFFSCRGFTFAGRS